jgi:hypothetical protein
MKNLLGDSSRSVKRNSAQAESERQIFVIYVTKDQYGDLRGLRGRQWDRNISEGRVASLLLAD